MTATRDLLEGWAALEEATEAYVEALAYAKGEAPERFANAKVRQMVESTGQTYQFRLAEKPIRSMTKRCRIASVTSTSEAAKVRLEEIRRANQAKIYEPLIIRKTFTFGDAYALVWPVDPAEEGVRQADGETVDVAAGESLADVGVEISYQAPLHCRVMYDAQDGRRPRYAIRRWQESQALGKVWHAEIHYADRVEPWVTRPGASGANESDWLPYAEDETGEPLQVEDGPGGNWPLENPWGEIAIKHFRTDLPYGEPAHAAAYGPQDAITKAVTTQVVVDLEAHGWPERYRLLDDQRSMETRQEPVRWDDQAGPTEAFPDGPAVSGRRRGSGLEHTYAGTRAVGEYTSPDPGLLIAPMDQWLRMMSTVTETPLDELDPTVQLSGISREKAEAPALAKEREAKAYLEGTWVEVYALAVRMTGLEPGVLTVTWVPPEVTMDADFWTTAQVRMELGVPIRQILAEANYLPAQIDDWLDKQGEEMALAQRISNLERLGTAIQTLGVAVQLGVLDAGTVNGLVQRVVGEIQSGDSGGKK